MLNYAMTYPGMAMLWFAHESGALQMAAVALGAGIGSSSASYSSFSLQAAKTRSLAAGNTNPYWLSIRNAEHATWPKTYSGLTEKFGASNYQGYRLLHGNSPNGSLLWKLNSESVGPWTKVYEAGMLNGQKVTLNYFQNTRTGLIANPYVKNSGWQRKIVINGRILN